MSAFTYMRTTSQREVVRRFAATRGDTSREPTLHESRVITSTYNRDSAGLVRRAMTYLGPGMQDAFQAEVGRQLGHDAGRRTKWLGVPVEISKNEEGIRTFEKMNASTEILMRALVKTLGKWKPDV